MSSKYTRLHDDIVQICQSATTYAQAERLFGTSTPNTGFRRYIKFHNIPMPNYRSMRGIDVDLVKLHRSIRIEDLVNGIRLSTHAVKRFLFKNGIKSPACEICGWCECRKSNGTIPVHLHHINGNPFDWRIENLQILCPNHHALTDNFGSLNTGKNCVFENRSVKTRLRLEHETIKTCFYCGSVCSYRSKFCSRECLHLSQQKCARPSKEQLSSDISGSNWTAIGRKYGVSDNAVRKWAKKYGII